MRLIERLRRTHATRNAEDGFTLIELLMTIVIVGIIATALAGVTLSYLKNTVATQARLSESQDVQFVAAYWQRDVASIGVRNYDANTRTFPLQQSVDVSPGCTLPSGTTVATLAWSVYTSLDSTATPTTATVNYVAQASGSRFVLLRVRCDGAAKTSQITVARNLTAVPIKACDVTCTGAGANVPNVVSLNLSVLDSERTGTAYAATLTGERRQT